MRFQLLGDWPINGGATLIPQGAMMDRADWKWNGFQLPWPPPINAMALDNEAYDELLKHYERHRIMSIKGVSRHGDLKP
jgi:hypothetical protein